MESKNYQEMYEKTVGDLAQAVRERIDLEGRLEAAVSKIQLLRTAAAGLSGMCNAEPEKEHPELFVDPGSDIGFTEAVRRALQIDAGLSAIEVRDKLKASGFKLESYTNHMAIIHTILNRLRIAKQVERKQNPDGTITYIRLTRRQQRLAEEAAE